MHGAALAFAGSRGAAVELGEEPVGVVRLGEEGGVAAIGGEDVGLPSSAEHTPTQTNSCPIDICIGVRMGFSG